MTTGTEIGRLRWAWPFLTIAALLLAPTPPCSATQEAEDATDNQAQTAAQTSTPNRPDEAALAELVERLDRLRGEMHIPGMSVIIVDRGEVVLARGFGESDIEAGARATADTVYPIGSSSKAFTATLLAMLAEEGGLGLDEPVQKYVAAFNMRDPDRAAALTVRDLLCHRSGLARMDLAWYGGKATREDILGAIARAEPMADYGEAFHYNNPLYMVAGMVAESVTGKPYASLLRDRFFRPLGMHSATVSIPHMLQQGGEAVGYRWKKDEETHERRPYRPVDVVAPAGAINASVNDLRGWIEFNLKRGLVPQDKEPGGDSGRLLPARWFDDELWKTHIDVGPGIGYGLGWMIREQNGMRLIEHGGNIDGFSSSVALMPDEGLGWAILTNLEFAPIVNAAIPVILETMRPSEAGEGPAIDLADAEQYLGEYPFDVLGVDLTVLMKNGRLAVDVPGQMTFELNPPDDEGRWTFRGFESQIAVSFNRNSKGDVVSLVLHQGGANMEAFRKGYEPEPDVPLDELAPMFGEYRFEPASHNWTVKVRHNRLAVDVPGELAYMLHPPDDEGWWRFRAVDGFKVKFERDEAGVVKAMSFDRRGQSFELPKVGDAGRPLPSIEDVMAAYHEANGADAYDDAAPIRLYGRVNMKQQGVGGEVVATLGDFSQYRTNTQFYAFGEMMEAVDGDRTVTESSFEPYTELDGEMAALTQRLHPAILLDNWARWFDDRSVVGWENAPADADEDASDNDADDDGDSAQAANDDEEPSTDQWLVVRLADNATGMSIRLWLDPKTWELRRTEHSMPVPGLGRLPIATTYDDYRVVAGVSLPYRVEVKNPISGDVVTRYESVVTNVDVPSGFFRPTEAAGD